ncbi:ribonuclease M5 [Lapidilactobacillus salsurivasis]
MIQEVIIVEGRDDTRRLREVFGAVDTIETRGSAVPPAILQEIKAVAEKRPLIVLTDPDFNGEQIRKKVLAVAPNAKQAFLPRSQARPQGKGSLGVEHASAADLRACLAHVLTTDQTFVSQLSRRDLVAAGLIAGPAAKQRRERLGDLLHIGYANGKQLLPRLQMLQVSAADFQQALRRLEDNDD